MLPRLFAFDLDGTLLTGDKQLSPANARALQEISETGAIIVFASGRIGSAMERFVPPAVGEVAMLTLNGAKVYSGRSGGARKIWDAPLSDERADYLIEYTVGKPFCFNYYIDDRLYAVRAPSAEPWLDLYHGQTGAQYHFVEDLACFRGRRPSKVMFVGAAAEIDRQESRFRDLWGESVYICRTWDHYLEFLDVRANKAAGLDALAREYGVGWPEIAAFGDAANDIPMLLKAGRGIAMANASPDVKLAAGRVSPWTNDEDGVAKEWDLMKAERESGGESRRRWL